MKDIKDYLLDSDHCPFCGSTRVEWQVESNFEPDECSYEHHCTACGRSWRDVLTITNIHEII